MIEKREIRILEQLFQMLDSLSLFDRKESSEMIDREKEISQFVTKNKIYIPQPFHRHYRTRYLQVE